MKIIDFQSEYYEKVNAFWNETGLGGSHRGDDLDIILSTIKAGGHLLIMLSDEGEVIGSSWLTTDKRRTYIHHFGIKERYRRKGLAKCLMVQTMEIAVAIGYQVKLEVHRKNHPAINLYRAFGFNDLGDYEVLINRDLTMPS